MATIKMKTNNQSTEKKVLNLLINKEEAIELALANNLSYDDFSTDRHREIFEGIIKVYVDSSISTGDDLDVLINNMIFDDDDDKKQTILTVKKLSKLTVNGGKEVPIKFLPNYIIELKNLKTVRDIIRGVQNITQTLENENGSVEDLAENVSKLQDNLSYSVATEGTRMDMKTAVDTTIREILDDSEGDNNVRFYLKGLDDNCKILKGYLTYIAGASGIGKSAVLVNLAHKMSINNVRSLYVSPEMSVVDNTRRLISIDTGIKSQKLLIPKLMKNKDWKNIEDMLQGDLPKRNIHWYAEPTIDIKDLESEIKRNVKLYDIDVVFIDYYQLLSFDKEFELSDSIRIPKVSRALSILAGKKYINPYGKEKQISIIALSQINKEVEYREDKRPGMNDMYFGGYKDARLVIGLFRDEYYNPDDTIKPDVMEFGIVKQNNGLMGVWFDTHYDSTTYSIRNLTDDEIKEIEDNEAEYEDEDDE